MSLRSKWHRGSVRHVNAHIREIVIVESHVSPLADLQPNGNSRISSLKDRIIWQASMLDKRFESVVWTHKSDGHNLIALHDVSLRRF